MVNMIVCDPSSVVGPHYSLSRLALQEQVDIVIACANKPFYNRDRKCFKENREKNKTAIFAEEATDPSGIPNYNRQDLIAVEVINETGNDTRSLCVVSLSPDITDIGWAVQFLKVNRLIEYCLNNDSELVMIIKPGGTVDANYVNLWAERFRLVSQSITNRRGSVTHMLMCTRNFRDNRGEISIRYNKKWGDFIKVGAWLKPANSGVKMIQINAAKRMEAHNELEILVGKKEADILMIQEPAKNKTNVRKIGNGATFAYNSKNELGPRACIWVSNELNPNKNAMQLNDFVDRDMVTINLRLQTKEGSWNEFILCSLYMPFKNNDGDTINDPVTVKLKELIQYANNYNKKVIISMDSNSHHETWGDKNTDIRGNQLLNFFIESDLILLNNNNSPTFTSHVGSSCIDLTTVSFNATHLVSEWRVDQDYSFSDHKAIRFNIENAKPETCKVRSIKKTNWKLYIKHMENRVDELSFPQPMNIEELDASANILNKVIIESYESSCRLKRVKHKEKDWCNDILLDKRIEVRAAFNKTKRTSLSTEAKTRVLKEFKTKRDNYKKFVRNTKRESWKKFTSTLEKLSDIARVQKILDKKSPPRLGSLVKEDGTFTKTEEETSDLIMRACFPGCRPVTELTANNEIRYNLAEADREGIMNTITAEDVKWAIASFDPFKAAGGDKIFPALLQRAGETLTQSLLKLFRASIWLGYIPNGWRDTLVTFLPKAGKDNYSSCKSYRPISLMSFVLKTLEKILDRKIRDKLGVEGISNDQFAYQKGKGCDTALHHLTCELEKYKYDQNKNISLIAFLDIEGAFDNTSFNIIQEASRKKGVPEWMIAWIKAMLTGRKLKHRESTAEVVYSPDRGCPQGGCLSPLMWTLVIDFLLMELRKQGKVYGYADDLAIVVSGRAKFASSLADKLNQQLRVVENWCRHTGLSVNPAKSNFMAITNDNSAHNFIIKMYGQRIPATKEFKYLGVIIDSKLSWKPHIENAIAKGKRTMWAARGMISKKWGLGPRQALWVYKQIAVPRVTYGAVVWWKAAISNKKALESLQRLGTMLITGAVRSTPSKALEALINVLPLDIIIKATATKTCIRLMSHDQWKNKGFHQVGHKEIEKDALKACELINNRVEEVEINREFEIDMSQSLEPGNWIIACAKREERTGIAILNSTNFQSFNRRLSDHCNSKQAVLIALTEFTKLLVKNAIRIRENHPIEISIQEPMILEEMMKSKSKDNDVITSINALNQANTANPIKIKGLRVNAAAGKMTTLEAAKACSFVRVNIHTTHTTEEAIMKVDNNTREEGIKRWDLSTGLMHSKKYIKPFDDKCAEYVISLSRENIRILTGMVTGHACLNNYLYRIGKVQNRDCRLCHVEDETVTHLVEECRRMEYWHRRFETEGNSYKGLLRLAKETFIAETFK